MSSTFGSFNTVRLGIYAAQKGLDVTGNNITNINTTGYTRQRLDQVSLSTAAADKYYSPYKVRVGQGVLTNGVSQLRDPGLDIAYRTANADVGAADAKLAGLEDLAAILDEVGKGEGEGDPDDGVILNRLNDLRDLINQALTNGLEDYESSIRTSASDLCTLFHAASNSLAQLTEKYETRLNDQVDTVNQILANLRDLNVSIRNADIRGDEALELRDTRNLLLDQLSQYVKIDVQYSMEDVGAGVLVEKMTVNLGTGDRNTLVDGEVATLFSLSKPKVYTDPDTGEKLYIIKGENGAPDTYTDNWDLATQYENESYGIVLRPMQDADGQYAVADDFTSPPANTPPLATGAGGLDGLDLGDTDLYGALQSTREMLTESGTYTVEGSYNDENDPDALIKRGIPFYQKALDSLANEFATQMNALNHVYQKNADGTDKVDENGNKILASGAGNLFSMGSDTNDAAVYDPNDPNKITAGITAANISISKAWAEKTVHMQTSSDTTKPETDTSRLAEFLAIFDQEFQFDPSDVAGEGGAPADALGAPYEGTFENMLLHIQSTLAEDQMAATSTLNNYSSIFSEVATDRESVTGVDLNDEATSLMTYQKAYTAACKLMTVLEEALDSLINGTVR